MLVMLEHNFYCCSVNRISLRHNKLFNSTGIHLLIACVRQSLLVRGPIVKKASEMLSVHPLANRFLAHGPCRTTLDV